MTDRFMDGLTDCQYTAISLLIAGSNHKEIALALGVDRKLLSDWKRDPIFAAALQTELLGIRDAARAKVLSLGSKAVRTLEELLDAPMRPEVRLAAAKIIIDRLDGDIPLHSGVAAALDSPEVRKATSPEELIEIQTRLRAHRDASKRLQQ